MACFPLFVKNAPNLKNYDDDNNNGHSGKAAVRKTAPTTSAIIPGQIERSKGFS